MNFDSKKRQQKAQNREDLSLLFHPKLPEKERRKGFNKLIEDSNRRLEVNENILKLNENPIIQNSQKMTQKKWNKI